MQKRKPGLHELGNLSKVIKPVSRVEASNKVSNSKAFPITLYPKLTFGNLVSTRSKRPVLSPHRQQRMITLYAKQKKRHRCTEQTFGLCGRRGWKVLRSGGGIHVNLSFHK